MVGTQLKTMAKKTKNTDQRAYAMLTDKCETFDIEALDGTKQTLTLYPLQLGRLCMISQRLLDLDICFEENEENEVKRMWQICAEKPQEVAEIIAIGTLRTKEEIDALLKERTELILHSPTMTANAVANVLAYLVFSSFYADFMSAIRSVKTLQVEISQPKKIERIATTEDKASGEQR